jgi:hypothetical protein
MQGTYQPDSNLLIDACRRFRRLPKFQEIKEQQEMVLSAFLNYKTKEPIVHTVAKQRNQLAFDTSVVTECSDYIWQSLNPKLKMLRHSKMQQCYKPGNGMSIDSTKVDMMARLDKKAVLPKLESQFGKAIKPKVYVFHAAKQEIHNALQQ